jgi:hypothetical protein
MVKVEATVSYLVEHNKIPETGFFDITEDLVKDYLFAYGIVHKKDTGFGKTTNIKFARRLAGLNLLKENISRGASARDIKAGHIYLISNPAFPLHYKIGVTFDAHKRLASYQTYSPYRDFVLEKYDFVVDKFSTEKLLLAHPLLSRESGEWVLRDNAKLVFDDLARSQILGI